MLRQQPKLAFNWYMPGGAVRPVLDQKGWTGRSRRGTGRCSQPHLYHIQCEVRFPKRWIAHEAHFDLLQLHFAQGYLLASFLSPLTNQRNDEYGGNLEQRMRFPLEVFDAVRAIWPEHKPISVALSVTDCIKDSFSIEDAIVVARTLKEHGCAIIAVLAGQTTPDSEPAYGRGFLTPLSDRVRNEAGIPTLVGGYLTTSNEMNTILAAGRADLCIMDRFIP